MKTEFLHRGEGNIWLILVFDGWSARREWLDGAEWPEGYDVLRCSGYSDFEFDRSLLAPYKAIHLYAWSLGVFAASVALRDVRLDSAYAVSGTESPVSDTVGIPESVFRATADRLDELNLRKFRRRMFGNADDFSALMGRTSPTPDDIPALKRELQAVAARSGSTDSGIGWTMAIIGNDDRIFPPQSQRRAWAGRTRIVGMESSHYVDLAALARRTLVSPAEVGRKFGRSLGTYDTNAIPQRTIALHLARMAGALGLPAGGRMLEIGPGTGLFTRAIMPVLEPSECVFVDVCDLPPFGLQVPEERYCADASRWLHSQPDESFDYIVSSSAIQWINSLDDFFAQCRRTLRPGGVFCASTYAEGTLCELDGLGVPALHYRSVPELRRMLGAHFRRVEVSAETLRVPFASAREALVHLKRTGVTAAGRVEGAPMSGGIASVIPQTEAGCELTYRPVYIIAFP